MRIRLWIVGLVALVAAGCSVPPNPGEMLCGTISFDERIWNRPGHEMTATQVFDLEPGTYSVRLYSRDDEHRAGYLPTQTEESWKLEGLDGNGAVVVATSATEDLAEDKTARQDDVGSYDFTGVTHVRGYHALGDQGVLNSITADYAEFWSANCGDEPYEPPRLAIAYTNVDSEEGYNVMKDILIAEFKDVDKSGDPSVGDVIRTNRYPTLLDATAFGTFHTTKHTIIDPGTVTYNSEQVAVGVDDDAVTDTGHNQSFVWINQGSSEFFSEENSGFTSINDGIFATNDVISADPAQPSPSQPDTFTFQLAPPPSIDDPFLDVDIYFTPPAP